MASITTPQHPLPLARRNRKWNAEDIPDLRDRTAVVTGASGGIGYEIALALVSRGAHVVLASRDKARTQAARERIEAAFSGARIEVALLDLSSLASVRTFAAEYLERRGALDMLVNNAGISGGPRRESSDGFEMHFEVNHLAHFALTGLLLPALLARPGSRVVTISSDIASSGAIRFDDLQSKQTYGLVAAYAQSKLANLLFARELERRSRATGAILQSFAAHPGVADSNLLIGKDIEWGRPPRGIERVLRLAQILLAQPAAMAALPALYQATDGEADPAQYVGPKSLVHGRGYPGPHKWPSAALDDEVAARLWEVSSELTGVCYEALQP